MLTPPEGAARNSPSAFFDGRTLIVVAALLLAGCSGILIDTLPSGGMVWILVLCNGGVAFFPIARSTASRSKRLDLLSPDVWFCFAFGILFFLRPIFDLSKSTGIPSFVGLDPTPRYTFALGIAFVGGMAFLIGFHISVGDKIAGAAPLCPRDVSLANSRVYVAILILLGIAGYGSFIGSSGGIPTLRAVLVGRNVESIAAMASSSGYLYSALLLLGPAGILTLALAPRWTSIQGLAGFALIFASILPHLGAGNRSTVLPALLSVAVLFYLQRNSRPRVLTWAVFALPIFVLLIVLPGNYRNSDYRSESLVSALSSSFTHPGAGLRSVFEGLDTAMVSGLAIEVEAVPRDISYQYGQTYLEALARPIPRALWNGKPGSADEILVTHLWPSLAQQGIGFSFSFFGEPYFNFGVLGVAVISVVFGASWRFLYEWYRRHSLNRFAMAIYASCLPFIFVFMRGGLGVDYQRMVIALFPIIVAIPLISNRRFSKSLGISSPAT